MFIDNANIKMQGNHHQQQYRKQTETMKAWQSQPEHRPERHSKDQLKLSDAAKSAAPHKSTVDSKKLLDSEQSLTMQIIRRMFKEITGQELVFFSPEDLASEGIEQVSFQEPQQPAAPAEQFSSGNGLVYQQSMSYFESETTTFSAQGSITTKDGKNIDFSVSFSMSRTFYAETNLSLAAGDAAKKTDPLVINFDGTAAELTSTKFQFDIDANGSLDQISTLKSNSGFLALDKNEDGQINDGSELFGAKTGNGFTELAAYDDDKNQFIDGADKIYQRLRIWQRHEDGSQQLIGLGDKNIGAIFLGHTTTPFQLKSEDNASLGEVASSGIYLTEQGKAGSVQQINFTA